MSTSRRRPEGALSLRSLLKKAVFVGAEDICVSRCVGKAEHCRPGDCFVPQISGDVDQHEAVELAVKNGAVAVVSERLLPVSIPQCLVENNSTAYAEICQALAGSPSQRMLTIGVVGTHSKTTTALFIASMLKGIGGSVAYYTSLGSSDSEFTDRTANQPPSARKLADWMRRADLNGTPSMVIELAQPMIQHQVAAGVEFDLLIVTGLRAGQHQGSASQRRYQEWLDRAVLRLKPHGMLLVNADDAQAMQWASKLDCHVVTYGLDASEDIRGKRLSRAGGQQQILVRAGNTLMPLTLNMPGDHIARAALAAAATGWMFDFPVSEVIHHIERLKTIPGRMQRVSQSVDVPIYIDAADTPDRLAVALHAMQLHGFGRCTAVVDLSARLHPQWRSRLGEVLEKAGARVVLTGSALTSDSARQAAMDVLGGLKKPGRHEVIPNRAEAIRWAVKNTHEGAILLAGCGANTWMSGNEHLIISDEASAAVAVAERHANEAAAASVPMLSIFPPPESSSTFKQ
ncbi:MAG: Mur ligase family protein [Pirellulales bacterium]